jgi:hypothetical protein
MYMDIYNVLFQLHSRALSMLSLDVYSHCL